MTKIHILFRDRPKVDARCPRLLVALVTCVLTFHSPMARGAALDTPAVHVVRVRCPTAVRNPHISVPTPAFLDSSNEITLGMDQPTTAAALLGHVVVRCGTRVIPVTRIDTVGSDRDEVVLAGTFQAALGGSNWQPDDQRTRMTLVSADVFAFQARLPRGRYQYKVARGGSWSENYGTGFVPNGANITINVPADNTLVHFQVDFARRTIHTSLDTPGLASIAGRPRPAASRKLRLTLARRLRPSEIVQPLSLQFVDGTTRQVFARDVLSEPEYYYGGDDLGARYSQVATVFKVWSPVSSSAELLLFPNSRREGAHARLANSGPPLLGRRGSNADFPASCAVPMQRGVAGVWYARVPGDLSGVYYQYRFTSYGVQRTTPDIYGRAASSDLRRSMVVDLSRTDPIGWSTVAVPHLIHPTDAVVYEIHTRDFTIDPSSGVQAPLRGKYLGLIAAGTHVPGTNHPTGLDYLRQLGVTDVQVMPFQSIAPEGDSGYSWGYAPDLFDVPEPRYATNPRDPAEVIREVKSMVAALHRVHIGLVMDVVYNHTVPSAGDASPFWASVPYYYFRTGPQGEMLNESGVGNALDDDHPMVRKFVCDSLAYWETQYHVDGFRFDLLGMFTPATVSAISLTLHRLRPDVLLYGEPWTGGGPTRFGKGAQRGLGVGVFNDQFRNVVRGDLDGTGAGFALGGDADPATLRTLIEGSPDFAQSPGEVLNYVSIHDDMTLWDKICKTVPADPAMERRALKLAGAIVILSQGVPILEGGAELGRTKQGQTDSYAGGDLINQFDWRRGLAFANIADYYRGLIAVRRAHPAFRCATTVEVARSLTFLPSSTLPARTMAFTLNGAPSESPTPVTQVRRRPHVASQSSAHIDAFAGSQSRILVIFHGATEPAVMTLPAGRWHIAVDGDHAHTEDPACPGSTLTLAPLSAYVLYEVRS